MNSVDQFLRELRRDGVQVWLDDGDLRCRAAKGRLTAELREQIARRKVEILAALGSMEVAEPEERIPRADRSLDLPLSSAQQRLWFLDQYDSDKSVYVIPAAIRLQGELRIDALRQSINRIVERHEVLRTVFPASDGRPIQRILAAAPVELSVIDLPTANPDELPARIRDRAAKEFARPFRLSEAPLVRFQLLRAAPLHHVLLLTIHHIVSDAWSVGVFVRELHELYNAICAQRAPILPHLHIQYADFAVWQTGRLRAGAYEEQLEYWKKQLQGAPPLLHLPWDRPRPALQTHRGSTVPVRFTETLTGKLKKLSQISGAGLYITLLAGFSILLARFSDQDEVVVGSPIASRMRPELEPLIGFFVNMLPMRLDLSDAPSFSDLLARAKQVALDAFTHQDLPFEELVERLKPQRSTSYTPLFQTVLALQNTSLPELELSGLSVAPYSLTSETAKFDLSLVLEDDGEHLDGTLEYNVDLFDLPTIDRLILGLMTLLEACTESPGSNVFKLPLLTHEQRSHALATGCPSPGHRPGQIEPIHRLFELAVEKYPEGIAVVCPADNHVGRHSLTYVDLNRRANQAAHYLRKRGVGPDVLVGVYLERSVELVVAVIGILKAGGAYLPLDPVYPPERLDFIIGDAGVRVILTQDSLKGDLPSRSVECICVDTLGDRIGRQPDHNPDILTTPDHLAYVIYTSGSTGRPKGTEVLHRNITRLFTETQAWFGFGNNDVWTLFHSPAFDFSVWELWGALIYGGKLVIVSYDVSRTPSAFYDLVCAERITILNQTPSAFRQLIDYEQSHDASADLGLRMVIFGGEALDPAMLGPWIDRHGDENPRLVNMYGITETTVHVTYRPIRKQDLAGGRSVIGRPIPDLRIYILDRLGQVVPAGVRGEIYVGGAGVARGYLKRPDLTRERFIPDPFCNEHQSRLYRTGDLGRRLRDGDIEYLGRADHQVKIRGFRIELGEIETTLASHPSVRTAVVIDLDDRYGGKRLVAYFVGVPDVERPSVRELQAHLRCALPDYMVPAAFVELDAIPLTTNGKINRQSLPVGSIEGLAVEPFVAPRTSTEDILTHIWCDVLHVERVGVNDNFFDLGGHSLIATQVLSRLRERLQVDLPLRYLFEAPTVARLAERIAAGRDNVRRGSPPPIRRRNHDGPLPLSYAQERLWFLDQLEPGNPFYNIPFAFRCKGRLNDAALGQTLNEVVRRHASLRTIFQEVDGKPFQILYEDLKIGLARQDLSHLALEQQEIEAQRLALAEALRPFCLRTGPLLRATLLELSQDDFVLLLTIHHIVADGWSMGVLIKEFSHIYPALARGGASPLPDLDIQYADFVVWQREWLQGTRLQAELDFWVAQLDGAPLVLRLPTDHPRPPVQTYRGSAQPFHLTANATERLKSFSQDASASLFMTLLAGFATLLHRYTGESDLLIGSPIANRNHSSVEPLIGFFVNTLALRVNLADDPPFRELVERVRRVTLDAYTHQDLPFEYLVERLKPQRDMGANPIVQVSFVFQNAPFAPAKLDDLTLTQIASETGTVRFDIEVFLWEEDGGLKGNFAYCTDLFEAETIARLVSHFQTLLTAIADNPARPVSELPLLTDNQRRQLLFDWNATAVDFPRQTCVHELFEQQAVRFPESVAVAFGQQSLTYWKLESRANQLARHLQTLGAGPEVLIGLCLPRSLDLVVAILGVLKAGAAYVPLDPSYPPDRLAFMVGDSGLSLLLTRADLAQRLPAGDARQLCMDTDWDEIARQTTSRPACLAKPNNLAYVIYTSGSTGRPKGTLLEHHSVVNYLEWARQAYDVANGAGAPVNTSIGFDATVTSIFTPLITGRRVELLPEVDEISHLVALLQSEQTFSLVKLTPAHVELASQLMRGSSVTGKIRAFIIGGEALTARQLAFWRSHAPSIRLINEYGPTETVVGCCIYEVPAEGPVRENIPIGRPIANCQLYVLDRHMHPVPIGMAGELYIGGEGVGRGYLNRPELTSERFIRDPFSGSPNARLYKSGDRVRYLADGNLEFLGRLDSQVKLRGYRVELGEIDNVLADHPAVDSVVTVVREDQVADARLEAYVVLQDSWTAHEFDEDEPRTQHDQVALWEQVFEDSYSTAQPANELTFNFAGWISSYTGEPIPTDEMREWVDHTVRRIRSYAPRKVWEIGCGTGLLLTRLARDTEAYLGTDFSGAALHGIQRIRDQIAGSADVQVSQRAADDVAGITGPFDTIILNSVIQYFPTIDYLLRVLDQAVDRLAPGGRIFVGDVRSLPLLECFHLSVEASRSPGFLSAADLTRRVRQQISREKELLLDPRFFYALQTRYPALSHVEVGLKRGHGNNELLRFRYDVALHFGPEADAFTDVPWLDWQEEQLSPARLAEILTGPRSDVVALRRVPNARLQNDRRLAEALRSAPENAIVAEMKTQLRQQPDSGVHPEELWTLGERLNHHVTIAPSQEAASFDVIFQYRCKDIHNISFRPREQLSSRLQNYGNIPNRPAQERRLIRQLRRLAGSRLPDYMVPSAFVILDRWPLTANGKLDRSKLPAPDGRSATATGDFVAPRTHQEEILAAIWGDVLGLERVGTEDNFFSLGGHSLLATQVISRVRAAFSVELQVRAIFEEPTIAGLARRLAALRSSVGLTVAPPPIARQRRGGRIPLSYAQQRLWFLDRLTQQSSAYNMPTALRLEGRLNIDALRKCFNEISARHEILRTCFPATEDGEPYQQIGPIIPFDLPLSDLTHLEPDLHPKEIEHLSAQVLQQRFDLACGPVWRAALIRLADNDHILLGCMHHIVSDGWSMAILVREIAELYTAFSDDRPHRLEPLPLQYADYGIWQRNWLTGDVRDAQVGYWQNQLLGAPPLLELPTDYPRPAVQGFDGGRELFELDHVLSDALQDLTRQHGASLFMTLLATFAVLLSRYSRMSDIVIGSPIAGRRHQEIESLIGFFVNTLVLRIDLEGNPSFSELLSRVRKLALDAFVHQDVPFEHLVDAVRPERNLGHAPVFQVMFVFQNEPVDELKLDGLTFGPIETGTETAKFDLTLCMGLGQHGLWGWLEYRNDLFEQASARRIVGHFRNLLRAVVDDPELPLNKLPWISESERRQVLEEWNQTHRRFDPFDPVHHQFERQVQSTPDNVAVELDEATLTFSALNERANRLAYVLIARGIKLGSRAGICMNRGLDMLVGVLAALKIGAAYVPLDSRYPAERLAFMLQDSQLDILLTQTDLIAALPQDTARVLLVDEVRGECPPDHRRNPDVRVGADDLAYVMYTSGSTGQPKGIAMRHGALANLMRWQLESAAGFHAARTLQFTSLSFDVSFQEIFSTLCSGGTLVLIAEEARRDSRELLRYIRQQRIERLFLPFVALQQLAVSFTEEKHGWLPLRNIITAGERLRITPELAAMMGLLTDCRLHNHYGPTETHVVTAITLPAKASTWPELPPIGRPIANTEIFILDDNMQPLPPGVPGELFIGGECLARGYWNRPELTQERFVPHPFSGRAGARLYRTGDLARYLKDGNIEFLGRCDDQLKIRGFRVEPGEIEAVLAKSPNVAEVAIIAREDQPGNRRLVGYIVPRQDVTIDVRDLRNLIRLSLPDYMVPADFVFLKALPLTPSGKINRRGLPAPDPYEAANAGHLAPRDATELRLTDIWEAVFDRYPVGVKDDFFELGGHSLLAVRLLARVEQAFGLHLPLSILFQSPTVESLARHLRNPSSANQASCLVQIQPDGPRPPLFCVPGAGGNVIYLFPLARRLGADQPFYGLQALGLGAATQATSSIIDLAACYVREIRALQPTGPYHLAGHSFGGMVAFEMAQQLRKSGQTVGLLVIFDTNAPRTIERPVEMATRDQAHWLCEIATVIEHLSARQQHVSYDELHALDAKSQINYLRTKLIRGGWLPEETSLSQLQSFLDVYKANILADYEPSGSVRLPIALFKAQEQMATAEFDERNAPQEILRSAWGWNEYAEGEAAVYITPGNHLTMMTEPHVTSLASKLRECLDIHQSSVGQSTQVPPVPH